MSIKRIIISPFSQMLRPPHHEKTNPKNWPHFQFLIDKLKADGHYLIQSGRDPEKKFTGVDEYVWNQSINDVEAKAATADMFISVDNFFPHMCHVRKIPIRGVVIWTRSDPKIYGYSENMNILKDRKHLRPDPYHLWEQCVDDPEAYVGVDVVYSVISNILKGL